VAVALRDFAGRAGVLARTVSNVVNDFGSVSRRDARRAGAGGPRRLDYRNNLLARSLRQRPAGMGTLLLPDLTASYFGEVAHAFVEAGGRARVTVMIDETGAERDRARHARRHRRSCERGDGVLLRPLGLHPKTWQASGRPASGAPQ
jgi:DNA-binding LacI/PurR family transcriptional regulator